jgi:hypothetical protein
MWLALPHGKDVVQIARVVDEAGAGGSLLPQSRDRSETLDHTNPQDCFRSAGNEIPSRRHE